MFRTRSYQNASRLIGSLSQDLGELVASGDIYDLKGIGKGLGSAISQAVGEELASQLNVPLLGKVPLVPILREGGDTGHPVAEIGRASCRERV